MLSRDDAEFFEKNGYLVAGPVLSADELEELREAYDRIFKANDKPESYRNLAKKEGEELPKGAVLQIIDMYKLDEAFNRILHKPEILDLVEGVLGTPNIRLFHDQGLYKPALHGDEVPWHQDNGYWKLDPPRAASLWIALDNVNEENGCMWVVPESHKAGEAGHQRAGQYIAQLKADADETLAVPIPLPAGSGMFHHCRTLHRTLPNHSPNQRRAWVMHYMAADTQQNNAYLPDKPLLRGEPVVSSASS